MKKKKLSLETLKVNSFITNLDSSLSRTIKSGNLTLTMSQELNICDNGNTNNCQSNNCDADDSIPLGPCSSGCESGLRGCTANRGEPIGGGGKGADTKICL